MENDNVYPTSIQSRSFTVKKDDKDLQQEVKDTLDQLPLLKKVVKRLDNRIEATDSVKQALVIADKYDITKEQALVVLDVVRQQLEAERNYIMVRVENTR